MRGLAATCVLGAAGSLILMSVACKPVAPNTNPVIVEMDGERSLTVNEVAEYWCDAVDHDGDSLSYAWSCSRGSFSDSGKIVHWTAPGTAGVDTMTVLVTDGRGGSATKSIFITVSTLAVRAHHAPPDAGASDPASREWDKTVRTMSEER